MMDAILQQGGQLQRSSYVPSAIKARDDVRGVFRTCTGYSRRCSSISFYSVYKVRAWPSVLDLCLQTSCHRSTFTALPCFANTQSLGQKTNSPAVGEGHELLDENTLLLKRKANAIGKDLKGTCIYLVGMMGSGKTTVGRILSDALGYHFFDSDQLVEEAAGGTSVAQIFKDGDEETFRAAETEVLSQLSCLGRLVVATGGGAVVRTINWSYLRHGITVWLNVPLDALARRVVAVGPESRPLLGEASSDCAYSQALSRLTNLLVERGEFYANADATVAVQDLAESKGCEDVNNITPTMIAIQVLEEISKLLRVQQRMTPMV